MELAGYTPGHIVGWVTQLPLPTWSHRPTLLHAFGTALTRDSQFNCHQKARVPTIRLAVFCVYIFYFFYLGICVLPVDSVAITPVAPVDSTRRFQLWDHYFIPLPVISYWRLFMIILRWTATRTEENVNLARDTNVRNSLGVGPFKSLSLIELFVREFVVRVYRVR